MNILDFIVIAIFVICLIVALVRGIKHPLTRFAGDAFSAIFAFFIAIFCHGVLFVKVSGYHETVMNFEASLPQDIIWLAPMCFCLGCYLIAFLIFFVLFRLLYRHASNHKPLAVILDLLSYLSFAYFLCFIICFLFKESASQATFYTQSLLASRLYPDDPLMMCLIFSIMG